MENSLEAIIAAMGFLAVVMVFWVSLMSGESPWRNEEQASPHAPRSIHTEGERLAA